jgi:hypothetical protein
MKTKTANSRQLDIPGNGSHQSAPETLAATLKRCRQSLGYFSIFATLPALLLPNIHEARTEDSKRTGATAPEDKAKLRQRLNAGKNSDLLKRQSKFRLPHQRGNFAMAPTLAGSDDCPGAAIPGGNYTAAAPYVISGDTTGANNTVGAFYCYSCFYLTVNSPGPDHIYSFILTDRGPNPKIEVSTASSIFTPLIYVLEGGYPEACPAAPGFAGNGLMFADSSNGIATINSQLMGYLPLHVPLYLLVDSRVQITGSYTLRMQDVTIAPPVTNAIDDPGFFVRQHYFDFLGRYPDEDGLRFWMNEITSCGGDQSCIEVKRINDSGAFFLSIEFQETGYLLYRAFKTAYGNLPDAPVPIKLSDFWEYQWQFSVTVNQPGWQQALENNKQRFFNGFVQTQRFKSAYPTSMTPSEFVDRLFANGGVSPSSADRSAAVAEFGSVSNTADVGARARALRRVAENPTLTAQEFNRAFVLMQYFGYLHRNPNDNPAGNFDGYNFWLDKLNRFNGDFAGAEMVKAFLSSSEYRGRFGP